MTHRHDWSRLLVCAVAVCGLAAIWLWLPENTEPRLIPPEGQEPDIETRSESDSATMPDSAPASQPASRPAESQPLASWEPPKSTARQKERDAMVRTIRRYGLADQRILDVMAAVPRHEFVDARLAGSAYDDCPLPIGHGQTISQPYIVAEMTRLLELKSDSRVLEIGTGSGYQAAVLAHLTPHVYTIEIINELADSAAERLKRLGYDVVKVRHGDGYYGWPEDVDFDAIIVTAAAGQIPPPLLKQLAPGGRMVIPIGAPFSIQSLVLVKKDSDGRLSAQRLMAVQFVPFVRKTKS